MNIFNYKYLSQEQLKRLNTYKYAAIDTSPLSTYVMHPFWNYVVEFVPTHIAPNVLTLAGFACTLMNAFLLTYYDYYFYASSDDMRSVTGPVPPIVWLICAINLFLAHTLDGIDGKQARRTKATGPLGELMDHGVDSWTAVFVPMYIYSLFGSKDFSFSPHRFIYVLWSVFFTFYITHWEKYNTGVLYLPWSYDVSQIFLFGCSIATFLGSHQIWKAAFPLIGIPYSEVFELVLYASIIMTLPMPVYNVYKTCKSGRSRYSSFMDIIAPLKPFSILFIASTIWATCSKNDILAKDPRVYFYLIGTIFSNIASRLIVCQMSSTKCEFSNGLCLVFALVALAALKVPFTAGAELLALRLLAVVTTLAHVHYAVCVVRQMCDHFQIKALTLNKTSSSSSSQEQLLLGAESSSNNNNHPNGMHAIVSGGSKGIGKSLAKKYAHLGYHVTIIARNERDLQAAKSEIEKCRRDQVQKIRVISMDLTAPDITGEQQRLLLGDHERCDILINCCGSSIAARFEDITPKQTELMMQVNYFSAVNLTRAVLPAMKARSMSNGGGAATRAAAGGGQIIFVSSMCGLLSFFGYSAYSASKFALVGMAEALHMELKPFGIGVTVSFPPDTDTPGYEEENKTKPNLTADISKAGSLFHPDEVAQAIIRDNRAGRFFSTIGLENWLVVMSLNSFMPSSFGRVLFECLLAGPLKLICFFILKSWHGLVDKAAPNEIIRAEIESKCSKRDEKKH